MKPVYAADLVNKPSVNLTLNVCKRDIERANKKCQEVSKFFVGEEDKESMLLTAVECFAKIDDTFYEINKYFDYFCENILNDISAVAYADPHIQFVTINVKAEPVFVKKDKKNRIESIALTVSIFGHKGGHVYKRRVNDTSSAPEPIFSSKKRLVLVNYKKLAEV